MKLKNNKAAAVAISFLVCFLLMVVVGQYLSFGWWFLALFFVFIPVSYAVAKKITGIDVELTLFK